MKKKNKIKKQKRTWNIKEEFPIKCNYTKPYLQHIDPHDGDAMHLAVINHENNARG